MRSTILVGLLILVLIFSTVSSGIIRMVKADSVIGSPIVVSKAPYRDLFDPDNGLIYVAGNHVSVGGNGGNVTVVDPSKNQAIKNITEPFNRTPRVLAYDSANRKLFVADVAHTVTVINTTKNKIIDTIPVNPITDGVVYDPANGDVYAIGLGPVSVIDASTDKVIKDIPVGSNSMDGIFDSKNGNVYVFNLGSGSVSVIDGATNNVLTTIKGLPSPVAGAFDPANGKIYVTNYGTNAVSVIDGSTNTLVNTITVAQQGPANALFDPDNNKIYIANQGHVGGGAAGNTLSVIDTSNDSVVDNIVIPGPSPVGLAYDPNKKDIYVTNFGSNENPGNTLTVLSTTSNAPDTIITSAIDGNGAPVSNGGSTLSTTIQIAFKGIGNNIVGFQCSPDGSIFSSCSSPFTASKLQAGIEHNFKVRAVDSFGNKDATPAVFSWFVLTPADAINNLIKLVKSMHLSEQTNNALIPHLNAALQFVSHGPRFYSGACRELDGFTNQVQGAERLNEVTPAQAFQLLKSAEAIETALGC